MMYSKSSVQLQLASNLLMLMRGTNRWQTVAIYINRLQNNIIQSLCNTRVPIHTRSHMLICTTFSTEQNKLYIEGDGVCRRYFAQSKFLKCTKMSRSSNSLECTAQLRRYSPTEYYLTQGGATVHTDDMLPGRKWAESRILLSSTIFANTAVLSLCMYLSFV